MYRIFTIIDNPSDRINHLCTKYDLELISVNRDQYIFRKLSKVENREKRLENAVNKLRPTLGLCVDKLLENGGSSKLVDLANKAILETLAV